MSTSEVVVIEAIEVRELLRFLYYLDITALLEFVWKFYIIFFYNFYKILHNAWNFSKDFLC